MDNITAEFNALMNTGGCEAVYARILELTALESACGPCSVPSLAARIDKLTGLFEDHLE